MGTHGQFSYPVSLSQESCFVQAFLMPHLCFSIFAAIRKINIIIINVCLFQCSFNTIRYIGIDSHVIPWVVCVVVNCFVWFQNYMEILFSQNCSSLISKNICSFIISFLYLSEVIQVIMTLQFTTNSFTRYSLLLVNKYVEGE